MVDETKRCPSLEDLLLAREDDGPAEDRQRLRAHLEVCATCRAELAELQAIIDEGGALLEAEFEAALTSTPEERYARLQARLARDEARPAVDAHLWSGRRWLWAAAVALLVGGAAFSRTSAAEGVWQQIVSVVGAVWRDPSADRPPRGGARAPRRAHDRVLPAPVDSAVPVADLDLVELDVRLMLRAADADLGGDLRIARTAAGVRVDGTVPARTLPSLMTQLQTLPHVRVALRGRPVRSAAVPPDALAEWLARHTVTGAPDRAMFVSTLAARIIRVDAHLAALQGLARRYPTTTDLSHGQEKLRQLVAAHVHVLSPDLHGLDLQIGKLPRAPAVRCAATAAVPRDWRTRAAAAAPDARALRGHLDGLLARVDISAEGAAVVGATFDTLWGAWYCPR